LSIQGREVSCHHIAHPFAGEFEKLTYGLLIVLKISLKPLRILVENLLGSPLDKRRPYFSHSRTPLARLKALRVVYTFINLDIKSSR